MAFSEHLPFAMLLHGVLLVLPLLVQTDQKLSGFISIDCGISDVSSYVDEATGFRYFSDANFTETGESRDISAAYKQASNYKQFLNVRSFPEGTRNCYTLKPAEGKGNKFLIRARFMYGDYDHIVQIPTFDLYLGVELWETVIIKDAKTIIDTEIIHVLSSDHIHICLVNTGHGTPFISALELRPLKNDIYVSENGSSLQLYGRFDFSSATSQVMRYEDDKYDRLWSPLQVDAWKPFINTSLSNENSVSKNVFEVPFTVMRTAYTGNNITWSQQNDTFRYFFYMHFMDLQELQKDQFRKFNIYINEKLWYEALAPKYLSQDTIFSKEGSNTDGDGKIEILLQSTNNSTLPPLINALEMYILKKSSQQETNQADVEAIWNVKLMHGIKRNWQGDPCSPEAFVWDGVGCDHNGDNPPTIITLNLSSSGLKGEIAPSIANLKMLQYLDLSNNNLRGTVPAFLAQLSLLRVLNLKGNNLTGPVPDALLEKSKNGQLLLSIDTISNSTQCSSGSCGKEKKFVVPLVAALGGLLLVFLIIAAIVWRFKRTRQEKAADLKGNPANAESHEEERSFISRKQLFTYVELEKITNNFKRVLGEGGFGKVYHGYLNGIEVAVKMLSPSSVQGHRQFHAELKLLLRVHHKNLTTLIGYCNEAFSIGLIYEYMAMGNLRSHLLGNSRIILSWEDRLRIAVDIAQGLEYLHNGCKSPIVHRDVKSTNILLNEKFQAKLSDFGLCKIFPFEDSNNIPLNVSNTGPGISTSVAGTAGYLDPEYYASNLLNEKSDVYSFGVLFLEMITARPVLAKTKENNHITEWVSTRLETGDIKSILDPRLEGGFDINTLWKAVEIAMACVSETSTTRPNMTRVAIELKECLATEFTRKNARDEAGSNESAEMMSQKKISEQLIPLPR